MPEFIRLLSRPVPYLEGLALQRDIHRDVVAGVRPDTVLLLEHESVYTAGRRTEPSERPTDGSPVIEADRGGKLTWHGPGQLVGYPILRLPEPLDVVAYVRRLEGALIDVLAAFGVRGTRVEGRSGVWVGTPVAKIAAIGIRVSEGVTMHGFALNCANSLDPYRHVIACGIRDAGATTLSREAGRDIAVTDVVDAVVPHLSAALAAHRPPAATAHPAHVPESVAG